MSVAVKKEIADAANGKQAEPTTPAAEETREPVEASQPKKQPANAVKPDTFF